MDLVVAKLVVKGIVYKNQTYFPSYLSEGYTLIRNYKFVFLSCIIWAMTKNKNINKNINRMELKLIFSQCSYLLILFDG